MMSDIPAQAAEWYPPKKRPKPRRKPSADERSFARAKGKSARKARKASR